MKRTLSVLIAFLLVLVGLAIALSRRAKPVQPPPTTVEREQGLRAGTPTVTVSGTVLLEEADGRAPAGAVIVRLSGPAFSRTSFSEPDGQFAFESPDAKGLWLMAWTPDFEATAFEAMAGDPTASQQLVLRPAPPRRGVVTDVETGAPLEDVLVELAAADRENQEPLWARSDAAGRFMLPNLGRAAAFEVRATKVGYAPFSRTLPAEGAEVAVMMGRGFRPRTLEFVAPPGTPASMIFPLEFLITTTMDVSVNFATDAEGRAAFGDLPERFVRITLFSDRWAPAQEWVDLQASSRIELIPRKGRPE